MAESQVKVGLAMSMHLVNEETSQIEERPVSVKLPKWMWGIIKSRAEYCHSGNLHEAFAEIMAMGLQYLGDQIIVDDSPIPENDINWN